MCNGNVKNKQKERDRKIFKDITAEMFSIDEHSSIHLKIKSKS